MKSTKIIALLPMKGNSERVPNKNMKLFNGKPLYRYTLDELLNCPLIDEVIVNTDSLSISDNIAQNYPERVTLVKRPENICGNYVSMNKIIEHDIKKFNEGIFIQTHSTNPLIKNETFTKALNKMLVLKKSNIHDSIFSVTKVQKRFYNNNTAPIFHDPNMLTTQHLEPIFEENSCFYIFTKKSFIHNNNRIGEKPYMFEINKIEATDIDDPEDFIIAETLYKELRLRKQK